MKKYNLFSIRGIGGLGKSTLAIEYLNRYKSSYNHLGYIKYKDNIELSIINAFKSSVIFKNNIHEDMLIEIQSFLLTLEGTNLIVIDNIKSKDELRYIQSFITNSNVLITTRLDFNNIKSFPLLSLSEQECKDLFFGFYTTENTTDNIDNILKYLDYHTLFIELTAKTLNCSSYLTLEKLESQFESGEFSKIYNNYDEKDFNNYLKDLLEINILEDNELFLLKKLSLFPSVEISFNDLILLLGIDKNKISFLDSTIHSLTKKGWIIKSDNFFKLHQIIKEFIFANYKLDYKDTEQIIFSMRNLLDIQTTYNLNHKSEIYNYLPFAQSIIKYFGIVNYEMFQLAHILAILLGEIGKPNDSLSMFSLIFEKIKQFNIDDELILSQYFNNLSIAQRDKGDSSSALKSISTSIDYLNKLSKSTVIDKLSRGYNNLTLVYIQMLDFPSAYNSIVKSISLRESLNNNNKNIELSIAYTNMGLVCYNLFKETRKDKYLKKGFFYQFKAICIQEETVNNSKSLSASYTNLSLLYQMKEDYKKALEYQHRALNILEHYYKLLTKEISKAYCNLALIYKDMNYLEISLFLHKIALEKRLMCLNYPHPELALSYNELSFVYKKLELYKEAISSQLESQKIYKLVYGKEYYDVYDSYLNLALLYIENKESLKKVIFTFEKAIESYKISRLYKVENLIGIELTKAEYLSKMKSKKELNISLNKIETILLSINDCPENYLSIYHELRIMCINL